MPTNFPTGTYGHLVVNTPGLLHFMRLNERSGTGVGDDGASLSGTRVGATVGHTGAIAGDDNRCYYFDGSNDYVTFGNNVNLSGAFSVEVWIKPMTTYAAGNTKTFLSKENYTSPVSGWGYYLDGMTPVFVRMSNGTMYRARSTPITAGVWTHLVATYDGTTLRQYKNGTLVWDLSSPGAIYTSAYQFTMGCATNGQMADNYDFFNGYIDDLAIYTSAMSASNVLAHYNRALTPPVQYLSRTDADTFTAAEVRTITGKPSLSDLPKLNRTEASSMFSSATLIDTDSFAAVTEDAQIEAAFGGIRLAVSDSGSLTAAEELLIETVVSMTDEEALLSVQEDRVAKSFVTWNELAHIHEQEVVEAHVVVRASIVYPQMVKQQAGFVHFVVSRFVHSTYIIQFKNNDVVPVGATIQTPFVVIDEINNPLAVGFVSTTWKEVSMYGSAKYGTAVYAPKAFPIMVDISLDVDEYPDILDSFGLKRKERD